MPLFLTLAYARLRISTILNSGYSRLTRTSQERPRVFTIGWHVDVVHGCRRCGCKQCWLSDIVGHRTLSDTIIFPYLFQIIFNLNIEISFWQDTQIFLATRSRSKGGCVLQSGALSLERFTVLAYLASIRSKPCHRSHKQAARL